MGRSKDQEPFSQESPSPLPGPAPSDSPELVAFFRRLTGRRQPQLARSRRLARPRLGVLTRSGGVYPVFSHTDIAVWRFTAFRCSLSQSAQSDTISRTPPQRSLRPGMIAILFSPFVLVLVLVIVIDLLLIPPHRSLLETMRRMGHMGPLPLAPRPSPRAPRPSTLDKHTTHASGCQVPGYTFLSALWPAPALPVPAP